MSENKKSVQTAIVERLDQLINRYSKAIFPEDKANIGGTIEVVRALILDIDFNNSQRRELVGSLQLIKNKIQHLEYAEYLLPEKFLDQI